MEGGHDKILELIFMRRNTAYFYSSNATVPSSLDMERYEVMW